MPSILVLCSLKEHRQNVCIMLSRFWQFSRDRGWSEFKTVKRKISNKDLFPENFEGSSKKLISADVKVRHFSNHFFYNW